MDLTSKERLIIFALGIYLEAIKKKVSSDLDVSIQKSVFIDFVIKTKLFEKKERAIYKNLETLENKRLLSYPNKRIILTERGAKAYEKVLEEARPYLTVYDTLRQTNIAKETKRIQTFFK